MFTVDVKQQINKSTTCLLARLYEGYSCHYRRRRWRHTLKVYVKAFYVIGKALSVELSCRGTGLVLNDGIIIVRFVDLLPSPKLSKIS